MRCIVNVTEDWGIGLGDQLLVTISDDLKRFRQLTQGHTVILGRKTLATFPGGRPLKNRRNLVLSRDPGFAPEGAEVFRSLPALLDAVRSLPPEDVWVIGGASLYEQLLPYCDGAAVTKTACTIPADRFFPDLDRMPNWRAVSASPVYHDGKLDYRYLDYENTHPRPL